MRLKGYKVYHTPHPSNKCRGGSAVIVKENIKHHEELKFSSEIIQATTIRIHIKKLQCNITAVYSPPRHNIMVEDYIEFLQSLGNRFVAGGDYNSKHTCWGSRLTITKGRRLLKAVQILSCNVLTEGTPTYWPTDPSKCPDVIDMFIFKGLSTSFTKVEGSLDLSSEHTPIVLTLSETVITKPPALALTNSMTDWNGFSEYLENLIVLNVPLKTKEQLENNVKLSTEQLQQAAKKCTPELKQRVPGKNYSLETKQMILDKRSARRKWQQTRHPADKTVFNNLSQQLKRLLNDIKNEGITSYLENLVTIRYQPSGPTSRPQF